MGVFSERGIALSSSNNALLACLYADLCILKSSDEVSISIKTYLPPPWTCCGSTSEQINKVYHTLDSFFCFIVIKFVNRMADKPLQTRIIVQIQSLVHNENHTQNDLLLVNLTSLDTSLLKHGGSWNFSQRPRYSDRRF